jgi:hypothetical protein
MFSAVFKTRWQQIAAVMMLAMSLFVAVLSAWLYWQVAHAGIETSGRFLRADAHHRRGSWLFGPDYEISYEFTDTGGDTHRDVQAVDAATFATLRDRAPGTPLAVRYARDVPIANAIDIEQMRRRVVLWFWIAVSVWGLTIGTVLLVARRNAASDAAR